MEKKKSLGVIIFTGLFIIFSMYSLLKSRDISKDYSFLTGSMLFVIVFCEISYSIASIIAGINIFRLKEWGRKLIVALALIGIFYAVISIPLSRKAVVNMKTSKEAISKLAKEYDTMSEQEKSRMNITRDEYISGTMRIFPKIVGIYIVVNIIYLSLMLFFFTRPKVKEQFK